MANVRIKQLRARLRSHDLDAILVTHLPHVRYLSGFSGSSGVLLVTARRAVLFTDFRYQTQVAEELDQGVRAAITRNALETILEERYLEPGMDVGFQEAYMSVASHDAIRRRLKGMRLKKSGDMVRDLTLVKSDEEIERIARAAAVADAVYFEILEWVRPGMRERDVAAEISYRGRKHGSEGDAFDIIVASGPRGALPHGRASDKKLRKGELVTLDFGCIVDGFASDMTRTFALGRPSRLGREIYDIVLRSQLAGVASARAGMTGSDLDSVCRTVIEDAGYGAEFGHSTGHGLGLEVHEQPAVAARGTDQTLLENMVVTIEPGIYLPEQCGVRIEDDVVITRDGCRVLNRSPKELVVV